MSQAIIPHLLPPLFINSILHLILRILVFFTSFLVFKLIILPLVSLCIRLNMLLMYWLSLPWLIVSLVRSLVLQISIFSPMIVLFYLIPSLIGALLKLCSTLSLPGQTFLLLFNKPISTWVLQLKIIFKLPNLYLDTFRALCIMVLPLRLGLTLCLPILMLMRLGVTPRPNFTIKLCV